MSSRSKSARFRVPKPLFGRHSTSRPNLTFDVRSPIEFNRATANFFSGDNGVGKTTFLEQVVIPHVERQRFSVLFWGPDSRAAELAVRMMLAVRHYGRRGGKARAEEQPTQSAPQGNDFINLLGAAFEIASASERAPLVMLDECEPSVRDFLTLGVDANVRDITWCIVRHEDLQKDRETLTQQGVGTRVYSFEHSRKNHVTIDLIEPEC